MESLKRGRGRPRKDGYYTSTPGQGGRIDPSNENFLRTEEREGGPIDPMTSFEDNVKLIFGENLKSSSAHPLYQFISQFGFQQTPGGPDSTNETETKDEHPLGPSEKCLML